MGLNFLLRRGRILTICRQRADAVEHCVADAQLLRLILLRVRIGDHVQPQGFGGKLALLQKRFRGKQAAGHQRDQKEPNKNSEFHTKTPSICRITHSMDGIFSF